MEHPRRKEESPGRESTAMKASSWKGTIVASEAQKRQADGKRAKGEASGEEEGAGSRLDPD
jgi:hypothetical protein